MTQQTMLPLTIVLLLCAALPAAAQNPAPARQTQQARPRSPGAYTLHVNAEEVVLNCTVLDH